MTKFWYQSSYDSLTLLCRKMYNSIYDYIQMLFVSKRKNSLSSLYKSKKKDGDKTSILFKKMLFGMVKDSKGLLGWEKDSILQKTKQKYSRRIESKMERREEAGQEWVYFNPFSNPPILRRGRVCKRTPTCIGKANGPLLITYGGSSSC
jgi:hypothetical protein